jgi:hypothetical protein
MRSYIAQLKETRRYGRTKRFVGATQRLIGTRSYLVRLSPTNPTTKAFGCHHLPFQFKPERG